MKRKITEGIARAADGLAPPQKKFFRQRAHINPLNSCDEYEYPIAPERMDWGIHFPKYGPATRTTASGTLPEKCVEVADVGCGFGGLLVGLAPALPHTLMLGMEIRPKVAEYVRLRILAMRKAHDEGLHISVIKTNAMKLLPHFFFKGQLSKMFFCFPDPHFKKTNIRRRIINTCLLDEYAYALREGGVLYTITDVRDLHNWMAANCDTHPLFERIPDAEAEADPCVPIMRTFTEEGQKVERLNGKKMIAVYRRLSDDAAAAKAAGADFWAEPVLPYEYVKVKNRGEYA